MTGPEDEELRDDALADEITLVGELIVAASASDGPLTPAEVDEALGLRGPGDTGRVAASSPTTA